MFDSDSSSSSSTENAKKPFNAVKEAANATQRRKLPVNPDLEKEIEHIFSQPVAKRDTTKRERKSRYIGKLVESAERRKAEAQRVIEQRIVKEREREDALFQGKERFVTPAYKRKLEENERLRQVEIQEEEEQPSGRNVSEFYHKLLQSSVLKSKDDDTGDNKGIPKDNEQTAEGTADEQDAQGPSGPILEYKQAQPTSTEEPYRLNKQHSKHNRGQINQEINHKGDEPPSTSGNRSSYTDMLTKPRIPKKRGLRRNTPESIAAYRQRYFERRAKRLASEKT
ncbi:Nuclear speckle splicing regulatory protein 1 [Gracilariopsis chorda]|uniref:Nuclear speckle splicing regulatory protein 1 n=1 Tax=Gracilariopsis chorda TaxID=448386 RepID=A0A2V3JAU7_9FLOR|nr:Nuclear speckle splicing regulatory protein 1 [Gracilariopsis chorda]|eukprot:PXF49740.1 Nuclear speckle splicing regulatory protein 1 [Gracilariopsis chorda]